MNKIKNLFLIISVIALCVLGWIFYNLTYKQSSEQSEPLYFDENITQNNVEFSDGLQEPDSVTTYPLDEYGMGLASKSIYYIDINKDDKPDKITKTFFENGNAHSYFEYKIELNKNGSYIDITPQNFRTINGTDCDLQQIQFSFNPLFHAVMIYREMGDNWNQPMPAKKRVYSLYNDNLKISDSQPSRPICDVKELF